MNREQKGELIRIVAAAALLIVCLLVPATGWLRLALFLVPYLLVGYEVLWTAIKNILHGELFDENFPWRSRPWARWPSASIRRRCS